MCHYRLKETARTFYDRLNNSPPEQTLHELRQQYHVLQPLGSIHRVIRNFLRGNCLTASQMGPLPTSSLQSHLPAFSNVGIDFFFDRFT